MKGKDMTFKIQKISSITLIVVAVMIFVLSLGFMTNFYSLFYDGTSEMYDLYKDIQMLNNVIFDSALYLIVLSILQIPFDFLKNSVSRKGLALSLLTVVMTISNGLVVFRTNNYFKAVYGKFDFSEMAEYTPSNLPFNMTSILFGLAMVVSVIVFISAIINHLKARGKQA